MPKGLVSSALKAAAKIFAHYSTIQMDGYRTLKAGQSVQFDVHQGPKGNHASVIVPVEVEAAVA
jgi:cold shock CspA family protein